MSRPAAHHRGTYPRRAAALNRAARNNPNTRCWKCGLTIDQIRHKDGKPARWTSGHVIRGQVGGELRHECSVCAATEGGEVTAGKVKPANVRSDDW